MRPESVSFVQSRDPASTSSSARPSLIVGLLLGLMLLPACSSQNSKEFGAVGSNARTSLNGLGIHKKMWEQAGAKCVTPASLSTRLESVDVIVLVPQTFDPPSLAARQWLEEWLQSEPGRTVIYFGRDFNAELYYLQHLVDSASLADKPLLQLELAKVQVKEIQSRIDASGQSVFCGWFNWDMNQPYRVVSSVDGPWAESLSSADKLDWPIRTRLQPPESEMKNAIPSWLTTPKKKPALPATGPVIPGVNNDDDDDDEDKLVYRSKWEAEEIESVDEWNSLYDDLPESEVLLESSQGDPLVYRLTSSERFGQGQVIVAVNGAPFLNATSVKPAYGKVGAMIVDECPNAKKVALLAYNSSGIQISWIDEIDARGFGLEMLVQWPLSAITIPACILGIVVCISLLPILGRPSELPKRSVNDFGMHIEALGDMIRDTNDEAYARQAVADYFRIVRVEQPPAWLTTMVSESTELKIPPGIKFKT